MSAQVLSFTASDATGGCGSGPIEVNITTDNFTDITSVGYTLRWDPNILEFVEVKNLIDENGVRFEDFHFNTTAEATDAGTIGFNWFTPSNRSLDNGTLVFTVVFNPAGGGTSATVAFTDGPPTDISAGGNNGATNIDPEFTDGTVTINNSGSDSTDPTISNCPSNTTVVAAQGETSAIVNWTVPTASDDCALQSLNTSHEPNTSFPIGLTKVTYTATDAAGNTATCTFDVTVDENPNNTGGGTGEVEFIAGSTTVACGADPISVDITTRDFVDLTSVGFSVEWDESVLTFGRVTNLNGTLNLTREDNFNTESTTTNTGALGFNWFAPANRTLGENDVLFTIEFTSTGNGTTSPISFTNGPPTTINITKNNGTEDVDNPILTNGIVTIDTSIDNEDPVISNCPVDIIETVTPGTTSAPVDWAAPNANDNCNLVSFSGTHGPGDNFPVGETTVTYTATDGAGNMETCEFIVTVVEEDTGILTIRASNEQRACPDGTVIVDVTVQNFVDITSLSFSMEWDETVLAFDQLTNLNNTLGLTEDDFNTEADVVDGGALGFSWFNFANRTLDPNAILFSVIYVRGNGSTNTTGINFTGGPPTTIGATANNGNDQVDPIFVDGSVTYSASDDTPPVLTACPNDVTTFTDLDDCMTTYSWTPPTATDECGTVTVTGTRLPDSPFPVGETTVTYTATDQSGNTATCSFVVTVEDVQKPTIDCPGEVNELASGSMTSVVINDIPPTNITDNCTVESVLYRMEGATNMMGENDASGNSFNIGTTQVTYIAIDASGNRDSCSFDINIADDNPDITCAGEKDVSAEFGLCNVTVDDINVTINSPSAENIQSIEWVLTGATELSGSGDASGQRFNVGTTQVTYTVTTNGGSMATCSFPITVLDTERPMINCPSDVNDMVTGNMTSVVVNDIAPSGISDNCSVESVSYMLEGATTMTGDDDASGNSFNIGVTTVTYTVTDNNGNERTCSFDVNIAGNTPDITCPDAQSVPVETDLCDAVVNNINITVNSPSAENIQSIEWVLTGATELSGTGDVSGQRFNVGTTRVTYTVTNTSGNSETCSFLVSVEDDSDPTFDELCPPNMIINNDPGRCNATVIFDLPNASDNCPVEVTSDPVSGSVFPIGRTEVVITARDTDNNTTTCSFFITVNDSENPVLECPDDVVIDGTEAMQVDNIDPSADDNCGDTTIDYSLSGATTGSGTGSASGLTFEAGETTVTYTATDDSGNSMSCSFAVVIEEAMEDTPPVEISCPEDITVDNDTGVCSALVDKLAPSYNEGSEVSEVTYSLDGATTGSGSSAIDEFNFNIGATTVTYIATDMEGRMDTCSFIVTVVDEEMPVYTCIADTTIAATQDCEAAFDWSGLITLTDNCEVDSLTQVNSHEPGDIFPIGTTTVSFSATDKAGNTVTCSFDVTVEDRTAPIASSCPPNITQSHEVGTCGAVVSWTVPTYSDNCTNANDIVITTSHIPGTTFPVGITTVIYTATDGAGNIDTCQFDINVTDTEAPLFSNCPSDTTISANLAGCQATYSWVEPVATDNCQVVDAQSTHEPGATFSLGATQVLYSAVDASGNAMVCTFIVTVVDDTAPVLVCPQDVRVRIDGTILSDPDGILTEVESNNCSTVALSFDEPDLAEDECSGTIIVARSDNNGFNSGDNFLTGTTTFEYSAIDGEGNTATCSFDIIVEGFEPLQIAINDDSPCAGEDLKFAAEDVEGGIYQWTLPDSTTVDGAVLDLDAVTVEQSGTYTINVVDANGCQYSGNLDLVISPRPQLVISTGSDMLCAQENSTLELMVADTSGADTISYEWIGPDGFTSTAQNPSIENTTTDNSGTYTVTATSGAGCTATASIDITIADRPEGVTLITSTTGAGACAGESMRLVGTNFNSDAVTYHWLADGEGSGLIDVDSFINQVTPTAAGTYIYQYYVTVGSCSSDTASVMVTVEGQPEIMVSIEGETVCADGTNDITLMTVSTGEEVEEWLWDGPDFVSTDQSPVISNVTSASNGTYTVTATTENGCTATQSIEVFVTSQPDAAEITASVEANCLGASFTLSVPEYEGNNVTYTWTAEEAAGLPANSNSNSIEVQPTAAGDFTYNLNVIVDGCVSQPTSLSVTTQAEPSIDLSAIPANINCVDGTTSLILTDNAGEGTTYTWTTPNDIELTGNNATINNITSADSGTYTVSISTSAGCSTTQSFTVNITDAIATPVIVSDNILPCDGDNVRLSVTNPIDGATYVWSGPSNYGSTEASPIINNVSDLRVGEYTVVVSKNGCTSSASAAFTLQVLDTPDLQDDAFEALVETPVTVNVLDNDILVEGANFEIGVISSTFNGKLENHQDGTFTYSPATGTRGFDQFVYEVCYTDCKDNCEIATVSIETKFAPDECVAFNIISPNGDGQNDRFVISCVDNNNFPSNSLVIVNQWGDEVYRAAPYTNNWGGTYEGKSLPDGTYYYIFIPSPEMDAQTGFITIQR